MTAPEQVDVARALDDVRSIVAISVCRTLGMSWATLYRALKDHNGVGS